MFLPRVRESNFFISMSILISMSRGSFSSPITLIVWDTQTGIAIGEIDSRSHGRVVFHGNQRTLVVCDEWAFANWGFYTCDAVSGTQLSQGKIQQPTHSILGAFWAHKDTLRFAMSFESDGKAMINIYELQPTSTSPLHIVSSFHIVFSFPVPSWRDFSFSPVSFHASFASKIGFTIFDVWDSQLLLWIEPASVHWGLPPLFSADGCFVAYTSLWDEVCVWLNASTCYVPWCNPRPQLPFDTFSWLPTSLSILCWGLKGIQLLYLDNCPSILSPHGSVPQYRKHIVAYSADGTHIAIAKQGDSSITVLNCLLGTPECHRGRCSHNLSRSFLSISFIFWLNNRLFPYFSLWFPLSIPFPLFSFHSFHTFKDI